jgi:hypothetical protein
VDRIRSLHITGFTLWTIVPFDTTVRLAILACYGFVVAIFKNINVLRMAPIIWL